MLRARAERLRFLRIALGFGARGGNPMHRSIGLLTATGLTGLALVSLTMTFLG